jgi:sensor histidine kinase regulating citrate/malate metabolism
MKTSKTASGWQRIYPIIESANTEISLIRSLYIIRFLMTLRSMQILSSIKGFVNLKENVIRHWEWITYIRFFNHESEDSLIITCKDDRIGIPYEEKKLIFNYGYGKNAGIGFFLAREILFITGLSIRECEEPGKGAKFEIGTPVGKYRRTLMDNR